MSQRYLCDANVLIALAAIEHVHHDAAETWFAAAGSGFATCPITQGSLVRVLLWAGLTATHAHVVLSGLVADERHEFWPDELSYRDVPLTSVIGHRQVTGAYLAALARRHGGRLATLDEGLAALHADVTELVPTA